MQTALHAEFLKRKDASTAVRGGIYVRGLCQMASGVVVKG